MSIAYKLTCPISSDSDLISTSMLNVFWRPTTDVKLKIIQIASIILFELLIYRIKIS